MYPNWEINQEILPSTSPGVSEPPIGGSETSEITTRNLWWGKCVLEGPPRLFFAVLQLKIVFGTFLVVRVAIDAGYNPTPKEKENEKS